MGASVFSFLMSLIWCSVFLLLSVVWHKTMMLKHGTGFALIVISVGIFRLLLPLDLPVSIIIRSSSIMPDIQRFFDSTAFTIFGIQIDRFHILIGVCVTGSCIYLVCLAADLVKSKRFLKHIQAQQDVQADKIMREIVATTKPDKKYHVLVSDKIKTPMLAGYFTPIILLPPLHLPDEELRYVLLHEWYHYLRKHLWVKLLFSVFCAVLWWNPLVYMAKYDLDYILEVNCDHHVVRSFGESRRSEYVKAMVNTIKQLTDSAIYRSEATVGFIGMVSNKIVQRCELILAPPKQLGKWAKSALFIAIAGLTVLSYSFIFQTAYDPPTNDSGGNIYSLEIDPQNSFLTKNKDGTYNVYLNGHLFEIIPPEEVIQLPYSNLPIINKEE